MQIESYQTADFFVEKSVSRGNMATTHYHNAYELYFLLHGEREYFIDDKFYKVSEHDVVLIPPSALHRTAGKNSSRILVYFTEDFILDFLTPKLFGMLKLGEPVVFRPSDDVAAELQRSLEELSARYQASGEAAGEESFAARILLRVLLAISCEQNLYESFEYRDERMEKIIRYINENYDSIDGLDKLAGEFFISKYHFCRIFRKNLGVSVTAYLNTIKIRAACKMLSDKRSTLTDVATKCGFNSVSYFCKVFKEEMGISPSVYRKRTT